MRLGELIDRSASFWRAHWKPLFQLAVGFQLAQFTLLKVNELLTRRFFPAMRGDVAELAKDNPTEALAQLTGGLGLLVVVALGTLFVSQVGGVATTHFVYPKLLGREGPGLGESVRFSLAKLWPTLGAFALSIAWSAVVGAALLVPGAGLAAGGAVLLLRDAKVPGAVLLVLGLLAALVGFIVLVLWFLIRFLLTAQVVALEGVGARQVFRRTDALSSGRVEPGPLGLVKARLTVLVTVIGALLVVVGLVATLPSLVLGIAYGASFQPGHTINDVVPQALLVPVELVQVVLGSLFAPLYVVFQVAFYLDMRVRREGLDLELKLAP